MFKMKTKRLLAAIIAAAAALSLSVSAAAAGTTGEDEIIEDPTTEEIVETPDEIDETIDLPMTPEPVAPVAPVANPETGNTPVALAVIPVALAAAAVVAKKSRK
jgi:hypothetical protein